MFKPAENTPLIGLMLVEALLEAGLPPGVINYLTGDGPTVGGELVSNPFVNGISFTGSYLVGTQIYQRAIQNLTAAPFRWRAAGKACCASDELVAVTLRLRCRSHE